MSSPVPADEQDGVRVELERVVRRWQQLPLDHALAASAGVRSVVQALADETAVALAVGADPVPDLGPAVLGDQLRVIVFDALAAGLLPDLIASRLVALRRSLDPAPARPGSTTGFIG